MNKNLKPCPICGREVKIESGAIRCNYCFLRMDLRHIGHLEKDIEKWNKRVKNECVKS